ncbi:uncharacterized protein KQ657_001451 [Scheffersomyces spartinae]|uniref:Cyclin N-terminal domain-containing protein n=1 Tax=Scheffersomyces spartinae TaxID=45513 RepID=A0A9P8AGT4_9ASCO|nr:uncharacterized protein KQ657_001451 [Scheffersomyces spartinae]KAG7192670.1 hypothetical protein KQ657_001451 [Scheffersomyces spartinae]
MFRRQEINNENDTALKQQFTRSSESKPGRSVANSSERSTQRRAVLGALDVNHATTRSSGSRPSASTSRFNKKVKLSSSDVSDAERENMQISSDYRSNSDFDEERELYTRVIDDIDQQKYDDELRQSKPDAQFIQEDLGSNKESLRSAISRTTAALNTNQKVHLDKTNSFEEEEEERDTIILGENLDMQSQGQRVVNEDEEVEEDVEDDDNDVVDDDEDEGLLEIDLSQPLSAPWNRQIFDELEHVMRKFSRAALDPNDEDTYDATMVAEYAPEIFNYMHELEHKLAPDPNYIDRQEELRWEMRAVLMDWVVQVHQRFSLLPETLYLAVNYIDRFLSKRKVSLSRFQLVGAVALFLAAKFEEINCPTIQEVAYMADNVYSIDDFKKAERFMIDVLEFDMGWPGPMSFLRRTSKADDYDYETRTLAKYFLEITIMDHRFVASQPSWLAAGAHYLSRQLLNKGDWTEAHVFYSGYTEAQLRPLASVLLHNCQHPERNHRAIYEKYQERRYRRLSLFVQDYLRQIEF